MRSFIYLYGTLIKHRDNLNYFPTVKHCIKFLDYEEAFMKATTLIRPSQELAHVTTFNHWSVYWYLNCERWPKHLIRKASTYESVTKSFRTGRLERELQMVQLSATTCSCIAILWVNLVRFTVITLRLAFNKCLLLLLLFISLWTQSGNFWIHFRKTISKENWNWILLSKYPAVTRNKTVVASGRGDLWSVCVDIPWELRRGQILLLDLELELMFPVINQEMIQIIILWSSKMTEFIKILSRLHNLPSWCYISMNILAYKCNINMTDYVGRNKI
jgi:hypothetical protein